MIVNVSFFRKCLHPLCVCGQEQTSTGEPKPTSIASDVSNAGMDTVGFLSLALLNHIPLPVVND